VPFSCSSVFSSCTRYFIGKAKVALTEILNIFFRSRCNSWKAKFKLFESICLSALLYGAEIWGVEKAEILETIQSSFLKYALNLPRCAANHIVRIEGNRVKIEFNIFKRALKFLTKLLEMENTRIPKIVWQKLVHINNLSEQNKGSNWASQLQRLMNKVDPNIRVNDLTADLIRENIQGWCDT